FSKKVHLTDSADEKGAQESADAITQRLERQRALALPAAVASWPEKNPLATIDQNAPLGKLIGEFWQTRRDEIGKALVACLEETDLDKARDNLADAEFYCRLLPGGLVPSWETDYPYAPPKGIHHLRLHNLLLWQGERTVKDHWFS